MYTVAVPKPERRPKKSRKTLKRAWMKAPHSKFCACAKCERKRKRRGSDPAYLDRVRALPCFFVGGTISLCEGRVHAHHAIHRSRGGKDDSAIPLCQEHHRAWHEALPPFRGLSRLERFAWAMRVVAETQHLLGAAPGYAGPQGAREKGRG